MTEFAFKINGTDFSEVVNRYGYETDRVPVSAGQFTDLAGVDHNVVLRWRAPWR